MEGREESDFFLNDKGITTTGETPLLLSSTVVTTGADDNDTHNNNNNNNNRISFSIYKDELKSILHLATPVIFTCILEIFPGIIATVLVGNADVDVQTMSDHTLSDFLAATSLSSVLFMMSAASIGSGFSTAMDTLCAQAHGADQTIKLGIYLQTGCLVMSVLLIWPFVVFSFAEPILTHLLGQPPNVAALSANYCQYFIPGIPFLFLYELLKRVLQAQHVVTPQFFATLVANLVNMLVGYLLVFHSSMGWVGAAIGCSVGYVVMVLWLLSWIWWSGIYKKFWSGFEPKLALEGSREWLGLGVPGFFQVSSGMLAFQLLAIFCGLLPSSAIPTRSDDEEDNDDAASTALSANLIVFNLLTLDSFYMGLSVAVSVCVGNELGRQDARRAVVASYVTLVCAIVISILIASFFWIFRYSLPYLFTNDTDIAHLTSQILYVIIAFEVADSIQIVTQGIFRGSGRQVTGLVLNLITYYVIGLPVGLVMGFVFEWGVKGLWLGITIGLYIVASIGLYIIVKSEWDKLCRDALVRSSQ